MHIKTDKHTLAVLIARFQVPTLTSAHIELIETALKEHPKVLILLGLSPVRGTQNNPLDLPPRKQMILEAFPPHKCPNLTVGYIKDQVSDEIWSKNLDNLINDQLGPNDSACLYGGRSSFIPHYKGRFETRELTSSSYISGTEIRKQVSHAPESSASFRAGAIWATFQRYPTVYPTTDVIVLDSKENRVLLARKSGETGYRAVGGFVSPSDNSYEEAALRELYEETTLSVGLDQLEYIGSRKVDDFRYRQETDKILTHLYVGRYTSGCARACDDIAEVRWFDIAKVNPEFDLVPEHRHLWEMFAKWISRTLTT